MNKYMIKKEFHESLYDSKGIWMIVSVSGILTALCILVMTIKEGSVLSQNDILQYAIKAVVFLTLMVSMVLGASSMIAEREENTLESLLLTPIPKRNIALAKYAGVMSIGEILLLVSVPYLAAISYGSGIGVAAIFVTLFGGTLLLIAFVAIAMVLSIIMKNSKSSVLTSILVMVILTLPAIIQGFFKLSFIGTFILKIDPVASCFDMTNKMLVDKMSLFALGNYILPLVTFAVAAVGLLLLMSKKISLKGEQ